MTAQRERSLINVIHQLDNTPYINEQNYISAIIDYAKTSWILQYRIEKSENTILKILRPTFQKALSELERTKFYNSYFESEEYTRINDDIENLIGDRIRVEGYDVLWSGGIRDKALKLLFTLILLPSFSVYCATYDRRKRSKEIFLEKDTRIIQNINFLESKIKPLETKIRNIYKTR